MQRDQKKARSHARAEGKEAISFAVPKELKGRLIELAREDGRTLSNYLLRILQRDLQEQEQREKDRKD